MSKQHTDARRALKRRANRICEALSAVPAPGYVGNAAELLSNNPSNNYSGEDFMAAVKQFTEAGNVAYATALAAWGTERYAHTKHRKDFLYALGELHLKAGKSKDAATCFESSFRCENRFSELPPPAVVDCLMDNDRFACVEEVLSGPTAKHHGKQGLYNLAFAQIKLGKPEAAFHTVQPLVDARIHKKRTAVAGTSDTLYAAMSIQRLLASVGVCADAYKKNFDDGVASGAITQAAANKLQFSGRSDPLVSSADLASYPLVKLRQHIVPPPRSALGGGKRQQQDGRQ